MANEAREEEEIRYPTDATRYKLFKQIASGDSSAVYVATCTTLTNKSINVVAVKAYPTPDSDRMQREADNMSRICHPNILRFHTSFTAPEHHRWVVMPYMSGGSVRSIMAALQPLRVQETFIAAVLKQILYALTYLHGEAFLVHRNISPGNILVCFTGAVKLGGCGLAASLHDSGMANPQSRRLTDKPYWEPPEVDDEHKGYAFASDVWSFGVTALELAYGRPPLSLLPHSRSMVEKIAARLGFRDLLFASNYDTMRKSDEFPEYFSESFKNMVGMCLEQEFSKRETPQKLLEHDFFKNVEVNDAPLMITDLLKELTSIDQRPTPLRRGHGDEVEPPDCRRVKEWRYDKNRVELVPVFQGGQKRDRSEEGSEASGGLPVGQALKKMMLKNIREREAREEREAKEERDRNAVAQVEGGVRDLQLQQNSSDEELEGPAERNEED